MIVDNNLPVGKIKFNEFNNETWKLLPRKLRNLNTLSGNASAGRFYDYWVHHNNEHEFEHKIQIPEYDLADTIISFLQGQRISPEDYFKILEVLKQTVDWPKEVTEDFIEEKEMEI